MGDTFQTIVEKGKAGYPAIYLHTPELALTVGDVKRAAKELKRKVYTWTFGKGLFLDAGNGKLQKLEETETPPGLMSVLPKIEQDSIIILKHFHHYMVDFSIQAPLLDIIPEFKLTRRMLAIISPVLTLPPEMEKEIALVELDLPSKESLDKVLDGIVTATNAALGKKGDVTPSADIRKRLIEASTGLTTSEAESAFALALVRGKGNADKWDPNVVMEEKCAALKKSGLLTYYPPTNKGMSVIGGMYNLKEWVKKRKMAFTEKAKAFGLDAPKGLLMVGPPGAGKSLGAHAIADELNLPLLRCDMGAIFAGLVGASEANARKVLQVSQAVAPCILWMDEIEKGFAGASAGSLDSGVGSRVLGTFLTAMSEGIPGVFVYATANDVTALPPELLRKGRFDEMFSVMLPTAKERKEIFEIHIKKRGREALMPKLQIETAIEMTKGYSGAEIEAVVSEAMYSAFFAGADLNMLDLQEACESTVPLSKTMKAQLDKLEEWCVGRTRPANTTETVSVTGGLKEGRVVGTPS